MHQRTKNLSPSYSLAYRWPTKQSLQMKTPALRILLWQVQLPSILRATRLSIWRVATGAQDGSITYIWKPTLLYARHSVSTDLPPLPRRFANTEEQEKAANLFINAGHTQAVVNLRGSKKAILVLRGLSPSRRVLEIVSPGLLELLHSPLC